MKPFARTNLTPRMVAEKAGSVTGVRPNPRALWREDATFDRLFSRASEQTLVNRQRCFTLYQSALQAISVDGDVAEVGVYRGGTASLLRSCFDGSGRCLHLFDTFGGMPEVDDARDKHEQGDFADTSLAEVRAFVGTGEDVAYHQGFFPETATPVEGSRFAFVHVDADIYLSVLSSCEFFYPRLSSGGIMIFDDYGFRSCPGARSAVDEFFAPLPEVPLYLGTGQCIVHKL